MSTTPPADPTASPGHATVYLVEDDHQVREALCSLLEGAGLRVECFAEAADFLRLPALNRPGCVVLDLRLPRISGIEVLETLRARGLRVPVIIITGYGDVNSAVRAMKAGASDFIEKPVRSERLIAQVRTCLEDDRIDSHADLGRDAVRQRFNSLTARERQVMERVVAGTSNKLIARELGVSPRTVEHHRARVMEKTGSRSLAELIHLAALISQTDT